ncbi:type I-C CRISPR-associated protein Cas7/Csd2 [Clostridia bacterium]|nr:type I-C CRISPR-associated protein Cas7/Csd2 [Clostridia bacterium]
MSILSNKIDFALVFAVHNANPNGDPLNGNRPRENNDSFGEVSDVCLKRKIRNRLIDLEQNVFVQSDEKRTDNFASLNDRAKATFGKDKKSPADYAKIACETWIDVRSFGQVFALKKGEGENSGLSVGVRGPVSIHSAYSVNTIETSSIQITKSVNGETTKEGGKSSDTMGMKHRVPFGLYVTYGSINCQLAEKTGFSEEDAELIKQSLATIFENDSSSARPDGSMEVVEFLWWKHNAKNGQYSSAKVHRSLKITSKVEFPKSVSDYDITVEPLDGLVAEKVSDIR